MLNPLTEYEESTACTSRDIGAGKSKYTYPDLMPGCGPSPQLSTAS